MLSLPVTPEKFGSGANLRKKTPSPSRIWHPYSPVRFRKFPLKESALPKPVHVTLDFALRREGEFLIPNERESTVLLNLFPNCIGFAMESIYITFLFSVLPSKPWPLTVAGVAAFFTDNRDAGPVSRGINGHGSRLVLEDEIRKWETPSTEVFKKIFLKLDELGLRACSVGWEGWRFVVGWESDVEEGWQKIAPGMINRIGVSYFPCSAKETWRAKRMTEPSDLQPDDSNYSGVLRPGVMMSSERDEAGSWRTSTSGVCVEAKESHDKYVTCAAHTFGTQAHGSKVFHPNPSGQLIGTVERVLWDSDIALIRLVPGLKYLKTTFDAEDYGAQPFSRLAAPNTARVGDLIHINSTQNGHCEGIINRFVVERTASADPLTAPNSYIEGSYSFFGTRTEQLVEGARGSVVWTDDFDVIGQFRCLSMEDGLAYMPSLGLLQKLGFSLSEV